ncbi:hypothetical protein C0992_012703 [Termitomyces sp. T32_za158]|nr:hypothetical protein C0992_012703 [Termitomyces sp. T32_za158]
MFVFVVYLLLVFVQITCATDAGIKSPVAGDVIVAGSAFPFEYNTRADYDVSSYNYTAWLFTTRPESLNPSDLFATGYFFGRYSQPNYPGNPYPRNRPPSQLIMPDFSQSPGGLAPPDFYELLSVPRDASSSEIKIAYHRALLRYHPDKSNYNASRDNQSDCISISLVKDAYSTLYDPELRKQFFADILLTPLEATRIRLVSERNYATGLVSGFVRLARAGGIRELYAGFLPILCKQIPYAIGQFTVNELCHEGIYRCMAPETRRNLSPSANFAITLGSGIFAGSAAAVLSQPADTLLSQINKGHGPTGSMINRLTVLACQAGFRGLFAGLVPRMIMTAALVSSQFLMYGAIKQTLAAPPGLEIHKE